MGRAGSGPEFHANFAGRVGSGLVTSLVGRVGSGQENWTQDQLCIRLHETYWTCTQLSATRTHPTRHHAVGIELPANCTVDERVEILTPRFAGRRRANNVFK